MSGRAVIVAPEHCFELQQQVKQLAAALQGSASSVAAVQPVGAAGFSSVLDLGQTPGLPAMPTLNGLLLGYPAVYWVKDLGEAELLSRTLCLSVLQLFVVQAVCRCVDTGSHTLMSFTVPADLSGADVDAGVDGLLANLKRTTAGGDSHSSCAAFGPGTWENVALSVEPVGPRPVSL